MTLTNSHPNKQLAVWTDGMTPKEKEEFQKDLKISSTHPVLKRLVKLLNDKKKMLDGAEIRTDTYDNPNWSYRQADLNGCQRTLSLMLQLLNHVEN